jgi:hypothetical protein
MRRAWPRSTAGGRCPRTWQGSLRRLTGCSPFSAQPRGELRRVTLPRTPLNRDRTHLYGSGSRGHCDTILLVRDTDPGERYSGNTGHHEVLEKVLRQRELHRKRSMFVRVAVAIAGSGVGVLGAILTIVVPELGLPLLLLGLRLLAYEFDWAARAYARVARLLRRWREWFRRLSSWKKVGLVTAAVLIVAAVVVWLV